jgi:hypothetical protein
LAIAPVPQIPHRMVLLTSNLTLLCCLSCVSGLPARSERHEYISFPDSFFSHAPSAPVLQP